MTAQKSVGSMVEARSTFEATLFEADPTGQIGAGVLLALPQEASARLPSRGMALVEGTINSTPFQAVLEPDGEGSHWFKVSAALREAARADLGDTVTLAIAPSKDWPEPKVPHALQQALAASPEAAALWQDITPTARWDWIRWIGATRNAQTSQRRVAVAIDKFLSGKRRPCCFDRSQCTLTNA